jgi:hypothetical protein
VIDFSFSRRIHSSYTIHTINDTLLNFVSNLVLTHTHVYPSMFNIVFLFFALLLPDFERSCRNASFVVHLTCVTFHCSNISSVISFIECSCFILCFYFIDIRQNEVICSLIFSSLEVVGFFLRRLIFNSFIPNKTKNKKKLFSSSSSVSVPCVRVLIHRYW